MSLQNNIPSLNMLHDIPLITNENNPLNKTPIRGIANAKKIFKIRQAIKKELRRQLFKERKTLLEKICDPKRPFSPKNYLKVCYILKKLNNPVSTALHPISSKAFAIRSFHKAK